VEQIEMNHTSKATTLLALMTLLVVWGCESGGGAPPVSGSSEEVTVKGTVTIKGTPATGGELLFDPANINRRDAMPRRAKVGKDGTFTVTTLVGENMVRTEGKELPEERGLKFVLKDGDNITVELAPASP
jgi:hypothetical protein